MVAVPHLFELLIPFATGETWIAVFGGLIPIVGLVAIGWIVIGASRGEDSGDGDGEPRARRKDRE
jgi:hypothetical protein